ncbi:MAG: nucleotidyltransferase family protein [Thaumarchaeota archaeon]|nr:nucleotidyltransferase family protein [Nitrososphaerota archaeon]
MHYLKAVILAAGEGKRMKPVSEVVAKEMVPILGRPFLYFVIARLVEAGIKDIVIVATTKKIQLIHKLEQYGDLGVRLTYATQREPLGPAHALLQARPFLDTDYFLVQYGDNIAEGNVPRKLMGELSKNSNADSIVALREVDDTSRYGIVRFSGKRIVEIVEKPKIGSEPSRLAAMGMYILKTKKFFESVEGVVFEYGKEQFPPEYIIQAGGNVVGWKFKGAWVDMGKPEDMLRASILLNAGRIKCIVLIQDRDSNLSRSLRNPTGARTNLWEPSQAIVTGAKKSNQRMILFVVREGDSGSRVRVKLAMSGNLGGLPSDKEINEAETLDQLYLLLSKHFPHSGVLVIGGDYRRDLLPAAELGMHVLLASKPEDLAPIGMLP